MEDNSNKQIVATDRTFKYDDAGKLIFAVETYYDYTVENRLEAVYEGDELLMAAAYDGDGNRVFQLNYNLHTDEDWKANSGNGNGNNKDNSGNSSSNNGKAKKNNNGNSTNAEETASQNQSGILFPVSEEVSATEQSLIDKIKTTGKQKNYELIEYINDVNREYVEVLVEQNINGSVDTSYVYGVDRLSLNRFDGSTGYYLYDGRGSVTGLTNEEGQIYQSYRYSVNGEITFGAPQYENEYTYNGESYNPNIESQYLRARYYNVVTATFLTEDSYLGEITNPLTLNRYNYTLSNYLNYQDPSGHEKLVISGGIHDGWTFKYQFIEPALHDINNLLDHGVTAEDITWIVIKAGYNQDDLNNFEKTAEKLGINIVTIEDKAELVNYINTPNVEICDINERKNDRITSVSIFSRGLSQEYSRDIDENMLGFSYHTGTEEQQSKMNFKQSDIELLEGEAFDNPYTIFYSCNAGTNDENGMSFAQMWSNKTGGVSIGIRNGRTDYSYINTSGNSFTINKYPTFDVMDYINKGLELVYNATGWEIFEPSSMWYEKMEKKEERNELGYAESGSLKYPELTSIKGDIDVILNGGIFERGWKKFEPQE